MSDKEWACVKAERERLSTLEPSQPYTPADCAESVFRGLTAKDFHVFEDRVEQKIQSLTFGFSESGVWDVRDNLGHHYVDFHTPIGKWIFSEDPMLPSSGHELLPFYRLSYVPPKSPEGFCHRIKVTVDRHDAFVLSKKDYCNREPEPSDPLRATKFGKQLERDAKSNKSAKIPLFAQTSVFPSGAKQSRVDVSLEFPWKLIKIHWRPCGNFAFTLGILGLVRSREGVIVSRFSDDGGRETTSFDRCADDERPSGSVHPEYDVPHGYEAQFYLASGEYQLQILLSDGSKLGRAEIPISIPAPSELQPALSSIALCKRYMDASRAAQEVATLSLTRVFAPLISKGIQFTPTAETRFRTGEAMIAYFEVFEPALVNDSTTKVWIQLKITDVQSGEVKTDTGLRPADPWLKAGSSSIQIAESIAFDRLPPGAYRLEVQASDSVGRNTPWQGISFNVE